MQLAIAGTGLDSDARAFMSQRYRQCMRRRPSTLLPVVLSHAGCLNVDKQFTGSGRL